MLAAVLGVTGSLLLCLSKMSQASSSALATVASITLGLVAGGTYALYSWVAHRLMQEGVGRAASMGAVLGAGGALLVPVLLVTGGPLVTSAESFVVAAYMALVPMFLGYFLFGYGLTRVTPSTATTLTLSEPAVAAILAVVVVGERLTAAGWLGLAIISAALVVLALAPTNEPQGNDSGHPQAAWRSTATCPRPRHEVVSQAVDSSHPRSATRKIGSKDQYRLLTPAKPGTPARDPAAGARAEGGQDAGALRSASR